MLGEESERVSIGLEITRGKALVGTVEGREVILSLNDIQDLLPLFLGGITSCRIVSADMEDDDRLVIGLLEVLKHTVEVESLLTRVIVSVLLNLESSFVGDTNMSGPGRIGNVDLGRLVGVPLSEELETNPQRSSTGDGLARDDSIVLDDSAVGAIGKLGTLLSVARNTINTSVLVIHSLLKNCFLSLFDAIKDVRLAIVISVGTHTKENLSGVGVLLESIIETEDGISRSLIDVAPDGGESSHLGGLNDFGEF